MGTLVEREEDTWKLLGEVALGHLSKNERDINPSDSTTSHLSPGRKKGGEACLKPCIRARKCLKVLQTQPSRLAEQCVVVSLASSIQAWGTGRVLPKGIIQFVLGGRRRRLLLWEITVLQGKQRKMLVWVRNSQREE